MTQKRNKNRGARRSSNSRGAQITRVPFHHVATSALVSGSASLGLTPSSAAFGALSSMYTAFDLYKFTKLRFRLLPNSAMASAQTAGFYPEAVITNPTITNGTDCVNSTYINKDMSVPSRWVNVPPEMMKGMLNWWKCQPDTGDVDLEFEGILAISGTGIESYYIEVEGTCLFKNPNNPAVVLDRIRNELRNEFQQSLNILPTSLKVKNT